MKKKIILLGEGSSFDSLTRLSEVPQLSVILPKEGFWEGGGRPSLGLGLGLGGE